MAEYSQSRGNLNRCDGPFLLNEHGDLYFLLHKNIVYIILLNLEKKIEKFLRRKKRYSRKEKIGPSYLLSENGDLSFLLFFPNNAWWRTFRESFKKIHQELFFF